MSEVVTETDILVFRTERDNRRKKHWDAIYHPEWQTNEVFFLASRNALSQFPRTDGWYTSTQKQWKEGIRKLVEGLGVKGYELRGRIDFNLRAIGVIDEHDGKWLNTIHTDCGTDIRLIIDLIEVMAPIGLIIPRDLERLSLIEVGVLFSNIFIAWRTADLGLVRVDGAKPQW
ncbi:hypothetical protein [Dyadobacter sp. 32]|uniref:hypothetical protein n=1 Tax=Dyadobacter sp. 32 TaxID=538966 RepID=UPI0011F05D9F